MSLLSSDHPHLSRHDQIEDSIVEMNDTFECPEIDPTKTSDSAFSIHNLLQPKTQASSIDHFQIPSNSNESNSNNYDSFEPQSSSSSTCITSNLTLFSQRTGIQSIKATPIEGAPDFCYNWSKTGKLNKQGIQYMACISCRSQWNKMKIGERPQLPTLRFNVISNEFVSLIPTYPHFCEPLLINIVRAREIRRKELANVKKGTRGVASVSNVRKNIAKNVAEKYGEKMDEKTRLLIIEKAQGTEHSLTRAVQRAKHKQHQHLQSQDDDDWITKFFNSIGESAPRSNLNNGQEK